MSQSGPYRPKYTLKVYQRSLAPQQHFLHILSNNHTSGFPLGSLDKYS